MVLKLFTHRTLQNYLSHQHIPTSSFIHVFPRAVVRNSKGWGGCSQRRSSLLHSKVCLGFVWVLWYQTGAQYSAGANTSAVVEVRKVSNEVLQLVPDSFLTSANRKGTIGFSLSKWFLYVRLRSRVIPRYVGYHSQFRIVLGSKFTLMDFKARWFLRWNSDDTVFDWESFNCQSCKYWHMVFVSRIF